MKLSLCYFVTVTFFGFVPRECVAHWEAVHMQIAKQAANSSTGARRFLGEYFGGESSTKPLALTLDIPRKHGALN